MNTLSFNIINSKPLASQPKTQQVRFGMAKITKDDVFGSDNEEADSFAVQVQQEDPVTVSVQSKAIDEMATIQSLIKPAIPKKLHDLSTPAVSILLRAYPVLVKEYIEDIYQQGVQQTVENLAPNHQAILTDDVSEAIITDLYSDDESKHLFSAGEQKLNYLNSVLENNNLPTVQPESREQIEARIFEAWNDVPEAFLIPQVETHVSAPQPSKARQLVQNAFNLPSANTAARAPQDVASDRLKHLCKTQKELIQSEAFQNELNSLPHSASLEEEAIDILKRVIKRAEETEGIEQRASYEGLQGVLNQFATPMPTIVTDTKALDALPRNTRHHLSLKEPTLKDSDALVRLLSRLPSKRTLRKIQKLLKNYNFNKTLLMEICQNSEENPDIIKMFLEEIPFTEGQIRSILHSQVMARDVFKCKNDKNIAVIFETTLITPTIAEPALLVSISSNNSESVRFLLTAVPFEASDAQIALNEARADNKTNIVQLILEHVDFSSVDDLNLITQDASTEKGPKTQPETTELLENVVKRKEFHILKHLLAEGLLSNEDIIHVMKTAAFHLDSNDIKDIITTLPISGDQAEEALALAVFWDKKRALKVMLDNIKFTPQEALPALHKAAPSNVRCMLQRVAFEYEDIKDLVYNALHDKDLKTLTLFEEHVELPKKIRKEIKAIKKELMKDSKHSFQHKGLFKEAKPFYDSKPHKIIKTDVSKLNKTSLNVVTPSKDKSKEIKTLNSTFKG